MSNDIEFLKNKSNRIRDFLFLHSAWSYKNPNDFSEIFSRKILLENQSNEQLIYMLKKYSSIQEFQKYLKRCACQ